MARKKYTCLYQILRDELPDFIPEPALRSDGDCSICLPSRDNTYCPMYTPITLEYYTEKDLRGEE